MSEAKVAIGATIEEALVRTGFGKFNYLVIVFSGLVLNNVVLESVGISFALPILDCDLDLTYQQRGILGAVGFIGIIASSHFWGFLADTTGRKRIMRPALMLGFFVTILSSFSPNFETLAIMRFLNGILLSAGSATVFAYLGEFHSNQYRNRAILSAAFISAFSAIFFPIIAWFFINQTWQFSVPFVGIVYKPWRSYVLACGSSGLWCGLLLFYLPESPKYLLSMGRIDDALAVLRTMHKRNLKSKKSHDDSFQITSLIPDNDTKVRLQGGTSSKSGISSLLKLIWTQTAPLFMRHHIRKTFLASVIQFIIFFSAHGVYMWYPYILNSIMQYTKLGVEPLPLCDILGVTQNSNLMLPHDTNVTKVCATHLEISTYQHSITLELIYVTLLLCISYVIGKCGRLRMLFIILVVCGTCGMAALVVRIPMLSVYLMAVYLCCGLGTTVVNAIVVDIYPTNLRAMAVCISLMLGRIGSVTGSNALGALIETNCETALFSSTFSLIIAGFLGFLLPQPKSEAEEIKETTE